MKEPGRPGSPLEPAVPRRLIFASRTWHLTLRVDVSLPELYRARFPHAGIVARTLADTVVVEGTRPGWFGGTHEPPADLVLCGQVPWSIELRHGGSGLAADLRGMRLESLDVSGGASRVDLGLPHPSGAIPIRFFGGVTHMGVRRPEGAAARLRVYGGATDVTFDGEHVSAVPGELRLESPADRQSVERYDVEIHGGACALTFDTYPSGT